MFRFILHNMRFLFFIVYPIAILFGLGLYYQHINGDSTAMQAINVLGISLATLTVMIAIGNGISFKRKPKSTQKEIIKSLSDKF